MKLKITETTDTSISFYLEQDGEIFIEDTLTVEELIKYVGLKNMIKRLHLDEVQKALRVE
jgi:hypothetical protein